ncbi:MAG: transposase, partial [Phycisphaerales bacterium]
MDHEVFRAIKRLLRRLGAYRRRGRQVYSDGAALAVYFYAVLNDRPTYWACDRRNWPPGLWRGGLPSQSALSRRLREPAVIALLGRVELALRPPVPALVMVAAIDGKALEIALHSEDPHAGKGRGVGHVACGYKVHTVIGVCGTLLHWRLASLNVSEREMARRMLRQLPPTCYVVGDSHYDTNTIHAAARAGGMQLVTPRKRTAQGRGIGKRRNDPGRLRSIQMLEHHRSDFARDLVGSRKAIERFFAQWTNFGGGLTCLPAWVRTYPRTRAW